jgi:hypothetical protein
MGRRPLIELAIALALGAAVAGCAATPKVSTLASGYADRQAAPAGRHLIRPVPGETEGASFQQVRAWLERGLNGVGVATTRSDAEADIVVYVSYGSDAAGRRPFAASRKHLLLVADRVERSGELLKVKPAWMVQVESAPTRAPTGRVAPVLVRAAQPHIGKTTPTEVYSLLGADDAGVRSILSGQPPRQP